MRKIIITTIMSSCMLFASDVGGGREALAPKEDDARRVDPEVRKLADEILRMLLEPSVEEVLNWLNGLIYLDDRYLSNVVFSVYMLLLEGVDDKVMLEEWSMQPDEQYTVEKLREQLATNHDEREISFQNIPDWFRHSFKSLSDDIKGIIEGNLRKYWDNEPKFKSVPACSSGLSPKECDRAIKALNKDILSRALSDVFAELMKTRSSIGGVDRLSNLLDVLLTYSAEKDREEVRELVNRNDKNGIYNPATQRTIKAIVDKPEALPKILQELRRIANLETLAGARVLVLSSSLAEEPGLAGKITPFLVGNPTST